MRDEPPLVVADGIHYGEPMHNNTFGFTKEDPWRVFRIMAEFVDSFETMSKIGPAVTVFGSARMPQSDRYYKATVELSQALAKHGLAVITGGGPGIMEAANRGAAEAEAKSVGLNIHLPMEQMPNPYITPDLCFQFRYFAMRKFHFLMRAKALVVFPGGFGTLDELFDALTLRQTGRMSEIPIIMFGREYWEGVMDFRFMADEGTIEDDDQDLFRFAETADEAWDMIQRFHRKYGAEEPKSDY